MSAVERNPGFEQVCIWPATIVGKDNIEQFVTYMKDEMGVRVQYLEEILTKPGLDSFSETVEATGGRNDVFFSIHSDDIAFFAVPRLQMGIRWVEDALASHNHSAHLYPAYVSAYKTW